MAGLKDAYNLIHKGVLAFSRAEYQGIRVDVDLANKNRTKLTQLIEDLEDKFRRTKFYKHWDHSVGTAKVNINSNFQLAHFLYKVKKITPNKLTPTGQGSTDDEALKGLHMEEVEDLLRIRKLKKIRDTYLNAFISESVKGFIHPFFNLHTVSTYRSSSDSPNFQNIPIRDEEAKKIIRTCLFPRVGHQLLEIDFSGIEVCISACYNKDPMLIKYINDPKADMHGDMARQIYYLDKIDKSNPSLKALRNGAKNSFVFPQFYGDYYGNNAVGLLSWADLPAKGRLHSDDGLELPTKEFVGGRLIANGIKSVNDFVEHIKKIENHFWSERFPVYDLWKKKWWRQYQRQGYFNMLTGFRCAGVFSRNEVINSPVQGTAFHCLLWAFIEMDRILYSKGWRSRLIGQIHDSMLFDVWPDELEDLLRVVTLITEIKLLKAWPWIIVPLTIEADLCEVDQSWYYKKEVVRSNGKWEI